MTSARVDIEDRRVAIAGGDVFVRRWHPVDAASHAPPVILLHDSLGCVELWREFPAQLARRLQRSVLAYDRLGFGRSSARAAVPVPEFIDEEAQRDFPALRSALGIDRYALFGHSVGGGMALAVAASDARCLAVVSESAQAFVEPRTLDGIRQAQAAFADPARFARLERVHGDKARWVLEAWTRVWLSPAFADWSLDAALARIRCPVLAIHGDRDEYGSVAFPRRIVERASGPADAMILPGCGHVPHREQADAVLDRVAAFLGAL